MKKYYSGIQYSVTVISDSSMMYTFLSGLCVVQNYLIFYWYNACRKEDPDTVLSVFYIRICVKCSYNLCSLCTCLCSHFSIQLYVPHSYITPVLINARNNQKHWDSAYLRQGTSYQCHNPNPDPWSGSSGWSKGDERECRSWTPYNCWRAFPGST